MRYIAHAGGIIDNNTYTNSKEALDLSYKNGLRIFELDIITTSDGKFVAAHDWMHWAYINKYKGTIPVNLSTFMNTRVLDKYTPMDMDAINSWFKAHPDAILVTDKINDPIAFSEQFIDPQRLMMELFDIKAVKDGIKSNILSAMPSQCVIQNMKSEDIVNLKNIGVTDIAISRRYIFDNLKQLDEFKRNDIKVYAFHVNFDTGIDEDYVTKYEMDYIYGIYADRWIIRD